MHASAPENLTKEEFVHCVQIVMSEDCGNKVNQGLIDELLNYAMSIDVNFDHLSIDARNIVNKVKGIK